jgi:hypothetical protein
MGYWEYRHTMGPPPPMRGGCCGPGCVIMMLTLPITMFLGFIRSRKDGKGEKEDV